MACETKVTIGGQGTRVTVQGGSAARITMDRRTTAIIADHRPRTVPQARNTAVDVTSRPTTVKAGNGMGVQGPKGEPGGTVPPIPFSFGDASAAIWMPDAAGVVTVARIVVTEAFDGDSPALALGTAAAPESILPPEYVAPASAGEYEATADVRLSAGEAVRLSISPGVGATQGAGVVYITFLPD